MHDARKSRQREVTTLTTRKHVPTAIIVAALVAAIIPAPAFGAPATAKKQEAARVKAQVDRLDHQLELAAESYNEARMRYGNATTRVRRNEARLAKLKATQKRVQTRLTKRAQGMYRSGPLGFAEVLLGATSFEEFAGTWELLQDIGDEEAREVAELRAARAEALVVERTLKTAQAQSKREFDAMARHKATAESRLASRQSALRGLEGEIASLEAAERRREAAAAAAARRRFTSTSYPSRGKLRAPRSGVVGIAMRYLGRPYRWAASGPNAFDCSGFTMFVYRQVGVSLPHSSRAQINSGRRVSRSELRPGDLVFFGSPIHHVGIYIGGGQMIHAPHTGDVVKISSIDGRGYSGACRP